MRSHYRMIAVSEDLGTVLSDLNPRATVAVVANGLDDGAFARYDCPRSGIAYLGRLEIAQKGLDLLFEAFARVADEIDQDLVIGGDGPDRQALEDLARSLGIDDRVRFVGRVAADRAVRMAGLRRSGGHAQPVRDIRDGGRRIAGRSDACGGLRHPLPPGPGRRHGRARGWLHST